MLLLKNVVDIYKEKFRTSNFKTRNVGQMVLPASSILLHRYFVPNLSALELCFSLFHPRTSPWGSDR